MGWIIGEGKDGFPSAEPIPVEIVTAEAYVAALSEVCSKIVPIHAIPRPKRTRVLIVEEKYAFAHLLGNVWTQVSQE